MLLLIDADMDALKSYLSDSEGSEPSDSTDKDDNIDTLEEISKESVDFLGLNTEELDNTNSSKGVQKLNDEHDGDKSVNTDFFNVSSDNKLESVTESVNNEYEHCDSDGIDFFGLSTVKKSAKDVPKKFEVNKKLVKLEHKEIAVEIPSSSFWSDVSVTDIQVHQATRKPTSNTASDRHGYNNKNKDSEQITGQKRSSSAVESNTDLKKHNKMYDNHFSSGVEKQTVSTYISEKRKMYFVHSKITPFLHSKRISCRLPSKKEWENPGHAGAINRIKWNIPNYSHLLVTCSMDSTVKVWNIWSQLDPCVQVLRFHSKAVRDVAWSHDGRQLLTTSYDKTAVVGDVEKGAVLSRLEHSSYVTCGKYHPVSHHVCVTGCNNQIQIWDTRTQSTPCRTLGYKDNIGQIQDIVVTRDGSTLFSCSDLVSRDSADRNLMAWDFQSGTVLSNQIYQERFTLTRLHIHQAENQLLAQSYGNYIAIFSLQRPYKMNKHKRFDGHKLQGYNIGFDVSPDGQLVYSGSSDGKLYCYDYKSGKHLRSINTDLQVVMDVASHPVLHSTVALAGWDGTVQVWK